MPTAPPLTLVVGPEELLVHRAVQRVVDSVREADPQADIRDVPAAELAAAAVAELLSPSLFGDHRVVVIRAAHEAGKQLAGALVTYAEDPAPGTSLVLAHAGGARGRALADAFRAAGADVMDCPALSRPRDRADFVSNEIRAAGRTITPEALELLLESVGTDLRELATAANQLLADCEGTIDAEKAGRYYRGRAEANGFAVADRTVEGDVGAALESTRWALAVGVAPVLITSSLAANLRAIARVAAAGRAPPASIAKALAMPPWKVDRVRKWSRAWTPDALALALAAVAEADLAVKGAAADAAYAVEKLVLAVSSSARR